MTSTSVIKNVIGKVIEGDCTVTLNSLLHTKASYRRLNTDDEMIIAGIFTILYCPVKISYGVLMIAAGLLLAPIPTLVAKISTDEIYEIGADGRAKKQLETKFKGVVPSFRTPSIPFRSSRVEEEWIEVLNHEEKSFANREHQVKVESYEPIYRGVNINVPDDNLSGSLPDDIDPSTTRTKHCETTVTGYGLATTGLRKVISGLCDPLTGLFVLSFFGIKKLTQQPNATQALAANHEMKPIKTM